MAMNVRNKIIPYGRHHITQEDIDAVVEVLHSDHLTQGPKVKEFEEKFAEYIGSKYAVAVANGTAALHLSALAMNIQPGDKVITTPITFAASANCVLYAGGQVDFVDIDPDTYLMNLDKLEKKLDSNPPGTYKGVIPVDFAGYPMNMERVKKIADKHNLWIIEDACHAPGGFFVNAEDNKQCCGNGNYADLAIFSFHPVKHIAAAEGGMITTNDETLYKKLQMLRTHGITKDSAIFQNNLSTALGQQPNANSQWPSWYYEMQQLGYNYRLSDIHAALGISQLKRADENLKNRQMIAEKYDEAFKDLHQITTPASPQPTANGQQLMANGQHAYHLYVIQANNRKELYEHLRANDIYAQVHYIPIHLQPHYSQMGWKHDVFPVAEKYYKKCLSLPIYPTLTKSKQEYVIKKITVFFQ